MFGKLLSEILCDHSIFYEEVVGEDGGYVLCLVLLNEER